MTSPCSGNTFRKYRTWPPKDDSMAIAWVLSCVFPSISSCVRVFASYVSATSFLFCSPACSSWYLGAEVAGALIMVEIAASVVLKALSAFTQDNAISWDADELYSTIFFSINEVTGAYMVKYTLVLFFLRLLMGSRWVQSLLKFLPSIVLCTAFFLSCFRARAPWSGQP